MSDRPEKPTAAATVTPSVKVFRAANRLVRPLLASRFHKPLSGRLMLLTYTGRKSGREFTVPIGYFQWDPGTVLATSSQLGWIPSMRGGPAVRLRIRGEDHSAVPAVIEDAAVVAATLREFARRKAPKEARMLGLPGDRQPTDQELDAAAAKTRLVLFRIVP